MENLDKILHQKFIQLGKERNKLTRELLAMLPEIYKREIYKKEGYQTIYEYAGKIAGLSKFVVEKILRTEKYLEKKPFLKKAILTQGIHKVALVAKIATLENEKIWADKIENMSKTAIQELSKEVRNKPFFEVKCEAVQTQIKIELDEEMQFLFLKLKNRIGKNMSNREAMRQILLKLTEQEFQKKITIAEKQIAEKQKENGGKKITIAKIQKVNNGQQIVQQRPQQTLIPEQTIQKVKKSPGKNLPKVSRYIPIAKKREVLNKNNGKCEYPGCDNPIEVFHHKNRFAISKSHDSVSGMCKIHHEFAHNGLIQNEKEDQRNWELNICKTQAERNETAENNKNNKFADRDNRDEITEKIDALYRKHRQEAI